jgi:hypothetical protein
VEQTIFTKQDDAVMRAEVKADMKRMKNSSLNEECSAPYTFGFYCSNNRIQG